MSQSPHADPLPALVQDADRPLNARVDTELFGHRVSRQGNFFFRADVVQAYCARTLTSRRDIVAVAHSADAVVPEYDSDWSAIRLVEDEIERRGLTNKYADALYQLTPWPTGCSWSTAAAVLRASCEQRCKAALSVCGALHDRRTDA